MATTKKKKQERQQKKEERQQKYDQIKAQIIQQIIALDRQQTMSFRQPIIAPEPLYHCQIVNYYPPAFMQQYQYDQHDDFDQHDEYDQYDQYDQHGQDDEQPVFVQSTVYAQQPVYVQPSSYAQQPTYAQQPAHAQQPGRAQQPDHNRQSGKAQQSHDVARAQSAPPMGFPQQTVSSKLHRSLGPANTHLERLQSLQDCLSHNKTPSSLKPKIGARASPTTKTEAPPTVQTEASPTVKTEASPAVKTEASPKVNREASPTIKIEAASPPSSRTDLPSIASPVLRVTESLIHHQSIVPTLSSAVKAEQSTSIKSEPDVDNMLVNSRKRTRSPIRELRPRKRICPRS